MSEEEARRYIRERFGVSRETRLARFLDLLLAESQRQNLIARSTIATAWERHILDSAQLLALAPPEGLWLDIGTGAGFPGIVVAILTDRPVLMVEPRRRRTEFLGAVVGALDLPRVEVLTARIEQVRGRAPAVISARAVARLDEILAAAAHLATRDTVWVLPKGANAQSEVEATRKAWQGSFHVEQSITHPESKIVVAKGVVRR